MSDYLNALREADAQIKEAQAGALLNYTDSFVDANAENLRAYETYVFDPITAGSNINLGDAKAENADKEPTVRRLAKETNLPRGFIRSLDNAELEDFVDVNGLHAGLKRWLATDVSNAIEARGSLKELDAICNQIQAISAQGEVILEGERVLRREAAEKRRAYNTAQRELGSPILFIRKGAADKAIDSEDPALRRLGYEWYAKNETSLRDRKLAFAKGIVRGDFQLTDEMRGEVSLPRFYGAGVWLSAEDERDLLKQKTPSQLAEAMPDYWFMSEGERTKYLEQQRLKAREDRQQLIREKYAEVRYDTAFMDDVESGWRDYAVLLATEIAAIQALNEKYGEEWKDWEDGELQSAINALSDTNGGAFDTVIAERLREVGFVENLGDAGNKFLDVFGVNSLTDAILAYANDDNDALERLLTGGEVSGEELHRALSLLEYIAAEARGQTFAASATDVTAEAVRTVGEFAATSFLTTPVGGATITGGSLSARLAASAGAQNARLTFTRFLLQQLSGDAARRFLMTTLIRTPFYVPKITSEVIWKTNEQVIPVVRDGAITVGRVPPETSNVVAAIFNASLDQAIEVGSESLGFSFPGAWKGLPDKVLNSAFVASARKVGIKWSQTEAARVWAQVAKHGAWNGLKGEYGEEKVGDLARTFATTLANLAGTEHGDLGQYQVFGSIEDEATLLLHLAIAGGTMKAPFLAWGSVRAGKASRDYRARVKLHESVQNSPLYKRDPEAMADFLSSTPLGGYAAMTPESARGLFQTAPEAMKALGITEADVTYAENNGSFITFSMAEATTKLDAPLFQKVAASTMFNPNSVATMETVENLDLSEEAYEKELKRREEEVRGIQQALNTKFRQLVALGRPADETRAVMEIIGAMARYHARYGGRSGVDWLNSLDLTKMTEAKWGELVNARVAEARARDTFPARGETTTLPADTNPSHIDPEAERKALEVSIPKVKNFKNKSVNKILDSKMTETEKLLKLEAILLKTQGGKFKTALQEVTQSLRRIHVQDRVNASMWASPYRSKGEKPVYYRTKEEADAAVENAGKLGFKVEIEPNPYYRKEGAQYQISNVYTGSAAYYTVPSTDFIGTGEGAQVYGWGLYATSNRGIADWYAENDAKRKSGADKLEINGTIYTPYDFGTVEEDIALILRTAFRNDIKSRDELIALLEADKKDRKDELEKEQSEPLKEIIRDSIHTYNMALGLLKNAKSVILHKSVEGKRHVYTQTIFPGKEEDLLDWDRSIPRDLKNKIQKALNEKFPDGTPDSGGMPAGDYMFEYLEGEHNGATGGNVYHELCEVLGSPKAASMFLYGLGIDGVTYIGKTSDERNYVVFNDKDIRIDEHVQFQTAPAVALGDSRINWDNQDGMGVMPDNRSIGYRGFQVEMSAAQFRDLVESGRTTSDLTELKEKISSGEGVASPTLYADWNAEKSRWEITAHEGRSRTDAITELYGADTMLPVHIMPYKLRARDITPEMLEAPFVAEGNARYDWAENVKLDGRRALEVQYQTGATQTAQKDAEYEDAVKRGDRDKALRMLREKAEASGVNLLPLEDNPAYELLLGEPPKKTVKVYKCFTIDENGDPNPWFVGNNVPLPVGVWLKAKDPAVIVRNPENGLLYVPTGMAADKRRNRKATKRTGSSIPIDAETRRLLIDRGILPEGSKARKISAVALRPGFHAGTLPYSPQTGVKRKGGSNYENVHARDHVVFECEMGFDTDYTRTTTIKSGKNRGGVRYLDQQVMPERGGYTFATNPVLKGTEAEATWKIADSLRIIRPVPQAEADAILAEHNLPPQEWEQGTLVFSDLNMDPNKTNAADKVLDITYDSNGNLIPLSERFNTDILDPRYQGDGVHLGATWTDPVSLHTIITLFENANSSTLIHEIGHYCFNSMAESIRLGVADQRMIDDFNALKKWAESNPRSMIDSVIASMRESARNNPALAKQYAPLFEELKADKEAVYKRLLDSIAARNQGKRFVSGGNSLDVLSVSPFDADIVEAVMVEQKERLARGFEAFVREGKAPTEELSGAFATMKRLLHWVYQVAAALNVQMTDEARSVFAGILSTEATVEQDSLVAETLRDLGAELEGMTLEEKEAFLTLAEKAQDQSVQELQARKARELKELTPQWKAQAAAEMANDPLYRVWNSILKNGLLDFATVVDLMGVEKAERLRELGLTTKSGRKTNEGKYPNAVAGVQPARYAFDAKYESIETFLDDLLKTTPPKEFTDNFVRAREAEYNRRAELDEAELTTQATLEFYDRVAEALAKRLGRDGYRASRQEFQQRAEDEIRQMTVRDILKGNDSSGIGKRPPAESRKLLKDLTTAVAKGDFNTAFEAANKLRLKMEILRQVGAFRNNVHRVERRIKQARTAKKGVMDGAFQHAIQDLAVRFGFTTAKPMTAYDPTAEPVGGVPQQDTFASLLERFNNELALEGLAPLSASQIFLNESGDYRNLSYTEFSELANIIEFLNGEGRARVSASKRNLKQEVEEKTNALLLELSQQKRKYREETRNPFGKVATGWRFSIAVGSKLRNLMKFADAKGGRAFADWYDELNRASSYQLQLLGPYQRRLNSAVESLRKKVDLNGLPEFPDDVKAKGYDWTLDRLIMCCLNMGNAKNRQRLVDGYGWTEEDVNAVASRITPEMWDSIQEIWNVVNDPALTLLLREAFRRENHFDMKVEAPMSFTVTYADGTTKTLEGGYFPLSYLFHRDPVVNDKKNLEPQLPPAFRQPSFSFERVEKVTDPLALNASLIHTHLFDVTHYISHREVMRKAMRVMGNHDFRMAFGQTQSFERLKEMEKLMNTMADPSQSFAALNSEGEKWYRYLKNVLTSTALWGSPETMAMQLSSITLGWDEVKGHLADAYNPANFMVNLDRARNKSGFMRERMNLKDLDIRAKVADLTDSDIARIARKVKAAGFKPMQWLDMCVAVPAWNAAYEKAMAEGKGEVQAVAYADEFVAKTQGGARVIDLSPAQLHKVHSRLSTFAVFFSATSAASTLMTAKFHGIKKGEMTVGQAIFATATTVIAPIAFGAFIRAVFDGPWDDDDDTDRAWRGAVREVVTYPFSGIPFWRDAVDFSATKAINTAFGTSNYQQRTVVDMPAARALSDLWGEDGVTGAVGAALDKNFDRAVYKAANATGNALGLPVLHCYQRTMRQLDKWNVSEATLKEWDLDEITKDEKKKKRRK